MNSSAKGIGKQWALLLLLVVQAIVIQLFQNVTLGHVMPSQAFFGMCLLCENGKILLQIRTDVSSFQLLLEFVILILANHRTAPGSFSFPHTA